MNFMNLFIVSVNFGFSILLVFLLSLKLNFGMPYFFYFFYLFFFGGGGSIVAFAWRIWSVPGMLLYTRLRSFDRHFEYLISVGKQTGVNAARTPHVFRKLRFSAGDDGRKSMAIWKQRWIHHGQYSTQLRKHIMNTISVIWYKTRVSYHRLVLSNKATQISPNVLLPRVSRHPDMPGLALKL